MKYALAALAVLSGALAQDTELPSCATTCVNKLTQGTEIGGCKQGDIACVCSNSSFLDTIACCLASVCSEDDQKKAVSFAAKICGGVKVDVPDQVVCSNSTGSTGSSSSSGTATSSSAPSSTSSGSSGSASSAPASNANMAGMSMAGLIGTLFAGVAML